MSVASSTPQPLTTTDTYGSILNGSTFAAQSNMVTGTPVISSSVTLAPGIWIISAYYGFGVNNAFTGTVSSYISSTIGGVTAIVSGLGETVVPVVGAATTFYEQGSAIINNNTGAPVQYNLTLLPIITAGAGTLNTTGPAVPYSLTAVFLG